MSWAEPAVLYLGALVSLTLALYVLARGRRRRIPLVAALAMLAFGEYLLGTAVSGLSPTYGQWLAWQRAAWWGAAFAPPLWLLLAVALVADEGPPHLTATARRLLPPLAVVVLGVAAVLAATNASTDALFRWSEAARAGPPGGVSAVWRTPLGPFFAVYQGFLVLCAGGAAAALLVVWRASPPGTPLRTRFSWLLLSAGLFLFGGVHLGFPPLQVNDSGLPGELLLIVGIAVMGWNLVRYGALLQGEVAAADFLAFAARLVALAVLYGGLALAAVPLEFAWLQRLLPLLPILLATHVLMAAHTGVFDRLFYGPTVRRSRLELDTLAERVARQPDELSALTEVREGVEALVRAQAPPTSAAAGGGAPTDLRVLVEGALRHLNDLPTLSQHPLLDRLAGGEGATAIDRGTWLRGRLTEAIERLRPPGEPPAHGSGAAPGAFLHYLVLREAYLEGRLNKQIMQRYYLSEGTFHRARRRAIDVLATDLHQRHARTDRPAAPG